MKKLYRYEIEYKNSEEPNVAIRLTEIDIVKETEKTYFIRTYSSSKLKRIPKKARNTYAYDNKEDAMNHFKRRTKTRVNWFHYWLENCNVALQLVENMKIEDTYICDDDNEIFDSIS